MDAEINSGSCSPGVTRLNVFLIFGVFILIFGYAGEHPIFSEGGLPRPEILIGLGKGFLAWIGCLGGILAVELAGIGILGCPTGTYAKGTFLAAGLLYFTGTSILTLLCNAFKFPTILFLLTPFFMGLPLWRMVKDHSILSGPSRWEYLAIALIGTLFCTIGLGPSLMHDDHVYHLPAINEFVSSGSFWGLSQNPNVYRPFAHGTFLAFLQLIFGAGVSGLANAGFVTAGAFILANMRGSWVLPGVLAWLSTPEWGFLAGGSYAEPFQCVILLLILLLIATPEHEPSGLDTRTLIIAGILTGLLGGTKYTGVVLLPLPFILLLGRRPASDSGGAPWAPLLKGLMVGLFIFALPFFARNYLLVGNPAHPHLGRFFSSGNTALARILDQAPRKENLIDFSYQDFLNQFGMGRDVPAILVSLWNVTVHGHFHNQRYSLNFFDGQISPLFLIAWGVGLGLAFLGGTGYRPVFLFGLFLWVVWLAGSHQIRFLMPMVAISAWFLGRALSDNRILYKKFWTALAVVSCLWVCSYSLERIDRVMPFLNGVKTEAELLRENLPFLRTYEWANVNLTSENKILVLLEERTFLLRIPHIWTGLLPNVIANFLARCQTAETAEAILRGNGVTHLLIPNSGFSLLSDICDDPEYLRIQKDLFTLRLKPVYQDSQCSLLTWANP